MLSSALKRSSLTLAVGDVVAFTAFGVIGLVSHEKSFDAAPVARSIVPFVVAWLVIAPWFGAFSEGQVSGQGWGPSPRDGRGTSPRQGWGPSPLVRIAAIWVPVGIVALCARALVFDRELFNAFFVIALVGHGLFLVSWRAVYSQWLARAPSSA